MSDVVGVRSTDGLLLEAELDEPYDVAAGFVLCHPHPKMGGTMNAPLLLSLRDELVRRGWAVLRFNFRGIGSSEGEASTGVAEVADALGAVAFMRDRYPGKRIAIGGWSFGGAVAVRAANEDPELAAVVAIAPAVKPRPGITEGLPEPGELDLKMPITLVCGGNDEIVALDDCRSWSQAVEGTSWVEIQGANHLFWAKYDDLAAAVADALGKTI